MAFFRKNQNKYGAEKVNLDGHSFGSKLEAAVYGLLKLRMKAGEIRSIQCQDHVFLSLARIEYIPDFKCTLMDGSVLFVEAKGIETPVFRIKLRLWRKYGPGKLEIWKGNYRNPKLVETVSPDENL